MIKIIQILNLINLLLNGKRIVENIGVAVFKKDKLVGELNASECVSFLSIRNDLKGFLVTIPNPENTNSSIDIYLTPENNTKVSVDIVNGSPYIKIKANFAGRIRSMTEDSKNMDEKILDNISTSCNKYLESTFSSYLYKTSKDFKSDITGLGKYALSQFLTTSDFYKFNWLENYKDAFFDVDVSTSVKSSILIKET